MVEQLVIPVVGRWRQVGLWGSLVSQRSLGELQTIERPYLNKIGYKGSTRAQFLKALAVPQRTPSSVLRTHMGEEENL